MIINKLGPPTSRGFDIDCDIYFVLDKPEADTITSPVTQAMIVAKLTAAGPYGIAAAVFILNYISNIQSNTGKNGCSVKLTITNTAGTTRMKEFIAEPI